jgi:anti-sigma-K factor RskA
MSAHISDDLPRLLTGDATRDETLAAADHLRDCADCQQELVSAVVAHASLTSAKRFAPEVVVSEPASRDDSEQPAPIDLPDLSAVFAQARADADSKRGSAGRSHRRRRVLAVAAAVAVLATGAGVIVAETTGSSSPAGHSVALRPFGVGTHAATLSIAQGGRLQLDATALPRLDPDQAYEVWLTDAARQRMQSVGFIGPDNRAVLTVSPGVLHRYTDIEVSRQPADKTQTYSGTSVLRGAYDLP